jgi:predicted nucleic-acid-binding Zn-ribbon protein
LTVTKTVTENKEDKMRKIFCDICEEEVTSGDGHTKIFNEKGFEIIWCKKCKDSINEFIKEKSINKQNVTDV